MTVTLGRLWKRLVIANAFAYCATDVAALASAADLFGSKNERHLAQIIADADLLIPCWRARRRLPARLRERLARRDQLLAAGKSVLVFGLTGSGDPMHPLRLSYAARLLA